MPIWAWIIIAVLVIVVIAAIAWGAAQRRRRQGLQEQFGPEYDRAVQERSSRREAESDLEERRRRREALDIRPLSPAARARYSDEWRAVQARFVDDPAVAVREAHSLVLRVMQDRGYPMDDFDQRAADISVDHPEVVQEYRAAHDITTRNEQGQAGTEDLRRATVHYRSLFEQLLGEDTESRAAP
jgi:hypothetical protein